MSRRERDKEIAKDGEWGNGKLYGAEKEGECRTKRYSKGNSEKKKEDLRCSEENRSL